MSAATSGTDQPRQRTVAELLAEHGDAAPTGRRRRRRAADDSDGSAVPASSFTSERNGSANGHSSANGHGPTNGHGPANGHGSAVGYGSTNGANGADAQTRGVEVPGRNGVDRPGFDTRQPDRRVLREPVPQDLTRDAPQIDGLRRQPEPMGPSAFGGRPPENPTEQLPLVSGPGRDDATTALPRPDAARNGAVQNGAVQNGVGQDTVAAPAARPLRGDGPRDEPTVGALPRLGRRRDTVDDDGGPPTQAGTPAVDDDDDDDFAVVEHEFDDLDDDLHKEYEDDVAGVRRRYRSDRSANDKGYGVAESDVDDYDDAELDHLRDDDDVQPARRRAGKKDLASSAGQSWAAVIAQWIAGAIGGAVVWVAFRFLWRDLPVVAIAGAVLVTVGLVLLVRHLLRTTDLRTTLFAVLVGLLLTVSPVILVLMGR